MGNDAQKYDEPEFDFAALHRAVLLAFLATSEKFQRLEDGQVITERMNDQARRAGILISTMSFGEGEEAWWVRDRLVVAGMLEMDKGDTSRALDRLEGWGFLKIENRDDGIWLQILPARLTLGERALKAAAVCRRQREERDRVRQPLLLDRSPEEERDGGFGRLIAEEGRGEALRGVSGGDAQTGAGGAYRGSGGASPAVGKVPTEAARGWESPNWRLGESQPERRSVGRVPTGVVTEGARTRAGIDRFGTDRQIDDSGRSGARGGSAAAPHGGARFRDSEKNMIFEQLEALDVRGELRNETSRRTWIGRIRDGAMFVHRGIDAVREDQRNGVPVTSPLGKVFVRAREFAKAAGKSLRCVMHL